MNKLYLASQSRMRKELLTTAKIPFTVISQNADESICDLSLSPEIIVADIARSKMDHALIPAGFENETCYVISADTICVDTAGKIHGKPVTPCEARSMLLLWRNGCTVMTSFCLDKKIHKNGLWTTKERIQETVTTQINFFIPDDWLEIYLTETPSMTVAGAMAIEEFGSQFVQSIQGSYTNIIGLPLFEVRMALRKLMHF